MDKLTSEQKRLMEEEKEHKIIPINPEKFNQILINIGRKKREVKK